MGSLGIVPNLGQIYNPDSFTGDGSEVAFTLTHLVTSDQSIIWVEGGVIQKPGIDFTVSGLTLTRTTAPANLVACFAMYLGVSLDIGVPSDGTVTLAKMAVNSVDSDQYVDGSIDAVHMSANSIDSDQYVDGSIDEAHIANDAINFATHLKAGTDGELITWNASGNPAAVPVGTATHVLTSGGTGVAPTFQAASGGDLRNFIIDGDFTQWPEGTTVTAPSSNDYGPALWHASLSGGHVFNYVKETSVLPTLAQSGHSSKQCMKIDVTTAESSVASGERFLLDYVITGTDYQRLEAQEVTLSFWVRSGLTGTFYVTFKNGGDNRFYMSAQTIDSADTWEKKTITLTLDTAGGATWLYTEADQGLTIRITLMSGTDRQVGSAVDTWLTGSSQDSKSDQTNFLSDTSKDFYISQVGLYLGDTAPTFLPESVATVKDQVNYYVHTATNGIVGDSASNNIIDFGYAFPRPMRATPSVTLKDTTPQFFGGANFRTGSSTAYSAVSTNPLDKFGVAGRLTGFGTLLTTPRVHMSSNADVVMFLFDARH